MDKEVKNRILLGKNGTKYVVADKYVDGTYSVNAIPGGEMVKFISENKLYKDIAYITARKLKGYRIYSLSVTFGSELDTSSKYAIYSLDSNGLMRVINLDTFEILECNKWNFQFLSREKGFKKPYINIYLKSTTGALECYAVTNLVLDKAGNLDRDYYLGDVDYNLGTNLAAFKKVNYGSMRRNKAQVALGADIAYSPRNLNNTGILDAIDRLDSENEDKPDDSIVETDNKPVKNDNEPVEDIIETNNKPVENSESLTALTVEDEVKPVEDEVKPVDDEAKPVDDEVKLVEDEVKPVKNDIDSDARDEISESELNSSDDIESETEDKPEEPLVKSEDTEDKPVETIDKTEETEDKPEETANEMDRFYDSNGNCIDIEGLMAYLDSKQIEKQLEETNKIDSKSSLADVLNKDTDLYQTY